MRSANAGFNKAHTSAEKLMFRMRLIVFYSRLYAVDDFKQCDNRIK